MNKLFVSVLDKVRNLSFMADPSLIVFDHIFRLGNVINEFDTQENETLLSFIHFVNSSFLSMIVYQTVPESLSTMASMNPEVLLLRRLVKKLDHHCVIF